MKRRRRCVFRRAYKGPWTLSRVTSWEGKEEDSNAKQKFQEDWPVNLSGSMWIWKQVFYGVVVRMILIKTSALEEHARSVAHQDAILLQERDKNGLEKCTSKSKATVHFAIEY